MRKGYRMRMAAGLCAALCMSFGMQGFGALAEDQVTLYEAESASLSGVSAVDGAEYSNGKAVQFKSGGTCTFTVVIPEDGLYSFNFVSEGIGTDKVNIAWLDGTQVGTFSSGKNVLGDAYVNGVFCSAGTHQVKVSTSWGWIYLDRLEVSRQVQKDYYDVSKVLVNPEASLRAQRLMSFLADNYGKNVISGQVCDGGLNGTEFNVIRQRTGKVPAILGMDLMDYTPVRRKQGAADPKTIERAIEFDEAGGIVELCWHWSAPEKYQKSGNDENGNPRWWGGFYTKNVNMDFDRIMNGQDAEGHALLMADIDAIAKELMKLKEADVPVLFRPLHEASGGWFWWGSGSAESCKKLWIEMYEKLTVEYGLDNLIWVWNGQAADWYPGDGYVDVIGEDIYPDKRVYSPQSSKFDEAANYTEGTKIVALTENGNLFDVDEAIRNGTLWSWFCVWGGDFCVKTENSELSMWKEVYGHERVLTLDELPDLGSYPIGGGLVGDVDGDGVIGVADDTLLRAYLQGLVVLDADSLARADVDRDGAVGVGDETMLRGYLKGLISSL